MFHPPGGREHDNLYSCRYTQVRPDRGERPGIDGRVLGAEGGVRRVRGGPLALLELALRGDADDVPGQSAPLEQGDQQAREVDLPPLQAVKGRAREGVMVVMPGLAQGDQREPGDVGRTIVDGEPPAAEVMADGVHRPRDVVDEEDADETAPDEPADRPSR